MIAAAALFGGYAAAEEAPAPGGPLSLELNNARDENGGCRLIYVIYNVTGAPLDEISYEAVVFDKQRRVSQTLILEFGTLPPEKTRVVQFDIAEAPCTGISRILINNISKCSVKGAASTICLDRLTTLTLTPIKFGV